jgi:endoglucanase
MFLFILFFPFSFIYSFKGINWYGFETQNFCLLGLQYNSLDYYLQILNQNNFNALRIPISVEIVLYNSIPPNWFLNANPNYINQPFSIILNDLFIKSQYYNISILIDIHRLKAGISSPLWYLSNNTIYTENTLIHTYDFIINNYGHYNNFLGIDLFNEPHYNATWGNNNSLYDYKIFVTKVINYFDNKFNKPFYIIINGIDWGKNLSLIESSPLDISKLKNFKNYIIYSPHLYGPSLNYIFSYDQEYLFKYWDTLFGFIDSNQLWIGEWGGRFDDLNDLNWIKTLILYMNQKNFTNHFFWALNPDSKDVDGLFLLDWNTLNQNVIQTINMINFIK